MQDLTNTDQKRGGTVHLASDLDFGPILIVEGRGEEEDEESMLVCTHLQIIENWLW